MRYYTRTAMRRQRIVERIETCLFMAAGAGLYVVVGLLIRALGV